MAYLQDLTLGLCNRCEKKPAAVRLINSRNARYGDYCRPCGQIKLKELQAVEEQQPA